MMAKSGVKANMASGEVTLKVCITPEQAALNQLPESNPGNCKHQLERKGAQILNRFSCIEPELSGEGTTTLSSPEAYRSTMSTVSRAGGKSETISVQRPRPLVERRLRRHCADENEQVSAGLPRRVRACR